MPFNTPTLSDLITRAQSDIATRLPGADAALPASVLGVVAQIESAAAFGLHQHLDWIARQLLPDTAEAETVERWAAIFNVPRNLGSKAIGTVTFSGADASNIPQGTLLEFDTDIEYITDAAAVIVAGTADVTVTARLIGEVFNQIASTELSLVNTLPGINSNVVVDGSGLTGGADAEDIERLRQRVVLRLREAPHGGAAHDYVAWALEAHTDITRAWVYPNTPGIGQVTVSMVTDNLPSPIPDAGTVTAVDDYIQIHRPVAAAVTVVAPVAVPLDITFTSLTLNTAATQAAINAELKDLLSRVAEPGGTILISQIREAISIAAGETDHVMTVPAADVTHATGEIATLGTITWP